MARDPIQHFLLIYDHRLGRLINTIEFGQDAKRAVEAYQQMEAEHRSHDWMDIVLVGSDSLDTIRVTHANYFDVAEPTISLDKLLEELLEAANRI